MEDNHEKLYTLSAEDFDHYFAQFCEEQSKPKLPGWQAPLRNGSTLSLHDLYEHWVAAKGPALQLPLTAPQAQGWREVLRGLSAGESQCEELQQVFACWIGGFPEYMHRLVEEFYKSEEGQEELQGEQQQKQQQQGQQQPQQPAEQQAANGGGVITNAMIKAETVAYAQQLQAAGAKRAASASPSAPAPKRQQQAAAQVQYQYTFGPNGIEYVDAKAASNGDVSVQPQIMAMLASSSLPPKPPPRARKRNSGSANRASGAANGAESEGIGARKRGQSPVVPPREPRQPREKQVRGVRAANAAARRRDPPKVDDPVPGNPIRSMMAFVRLASLALPGASGDARQDPDAVAKMAALARRYRERFGRLAYATRVPLPDELLPLFCGVGPSRRSQRVRSGPAFFHPDWTKLDVLQRRSSEQNAICQGPHYQALIPPLRARPQDMPPEEARWLGTTVYTPEDWPPADATATAAATAAAAGAAAAVAAAGGGASAAGAAAGAAAAAASAAARSAARLAAAAARAAVQAAKPLRAAESDDRRRILLQMELERGDEELGELAQALGLSHLGPLKGRTSWTPEEEASFALGMLRHGRHFKRIRKFLLPSRAVPELIDYYYNVWKMLGAPLAVMWAAEDWLEREPEEWEATVRTVLAEVTDGRAQLPALTNARGRAAAAAIGAGRSPSPSRSESPSLVAEPAPRPRVQRKRPSARSAPPSRDPRRAKTPSPETSESMDPEVVIESSSPSTSGDMGGSASPGSEEVMVLPRAVAAAPAVPGAPPPLRNPNRTTKLTPAQIAANDRRALRTLLDWVRLVGKGVNGGNPSGYNPKTQKRRAEVARNAMLNPGLAALAASELNNATAAEAAAAAAAAVAAASAAKAASARGKRRNSDAAEAPAGRRRVSRKSSGGSA